jgi:choline dehydrogenase
MTTSVSFSRNTRTTRPFSQVYLLFVSLPLHFFLSGIQTYWESTVVGSVTPFLYATPNMMFFGPEKTGSPRFQFELSSNFASVYPDHLHLEGTVRLASTDPLALPIIDYNLTPAYEEEILWGVKNVLLPAVSAIQAQGVWGVGFTPVQPGATDADIRQWTRDTISTNYHPLGTARVGSYNDPTSVVDPRFRVRGISHLRVVDASVHRVLPTGNINSPTLCLAYFGADVIADDNNL